MFKTYLYYNGEQKLVETHGSELRAVRSGENWRLLRRGNTFKVVEDVVKKSRIRELLRF